MCVTETFDGKPADFWVLPIHMFIRRSCQEWNLLCQRSNIFCHKSNIFCHKQIIDLVINETKTFIIEIHFFTYEIYVFTNEKYFVNRDFYLTIDNESIIFKREIAFFTNETDSGVSFVKKKLFFNTLAQVFRRMIHKKQNSTCHYFWQISYWNV